jgi:hypothetical protein
MAARNGVGGIGGATSARDGVGAKGSAGDATIAGGIFWALELSDLTFGPAPTVAAGGVVWGAASAELESSAPGAKAAEAIPLAGATVGVSPDGAFAAAAAVSIFAKTILGAEHMIAAAISATAVVMNASHVFARRGDVFLCVLSIISILSLS